MVEWTSEEEIEGEFPVPLELGTGDMLMQFNVNCDDDELMMMVMRPLTRTALTWSLVPQRAG